MVACAMQEVLLDYNVQNQIVRKKTNLYIITDHEGLQVPSKRHELSLGPLTPPKFQSISYCVV